MTSSTLTGRATGEKGGEEEEEEDEDADLSRALELVIAGALIPIGEKTRELREDIQRHEEKR